MLLKIKQDCKYGYILRFLLVIIGFLHNYQSYAIYICIRQVLQFLLVKTGTIHARIKWLIFTCSRYLRPKFSILNSEKQCYQNKLFYEIFRKILFFFNKKANGAWFIHIWKRKLPDYGKFINESDLLMCQKEAILERAKIVISQIISTNVVNFTMFLYSLEKTRCIF